MGLANLTVVKSVETQIRLKTLIRVRCRLHMMLVTRQVSNVAKGR